MRYYLRVVSLPLFLLIVSLSLRVAEHLVDVPDPEVLIATVSGWLSTYGLPVLFVSAVVEGMLLVGGYFPGVFVIFITMLIAETPQQAVLYVVVGTAGLYLAHIANYFLGKYGWYRLLVRMGLRGAIRNAEERVERYGPVAIFSSYWLPSLASLTDTAAGITRMSFAKFAICSLVASVLWNSLAGFIMYQLGEAAIPLVAPGGDDLLLTLGILFGWMAILLALDYRRRRLAAR
jgi:membrane protein DedA with SNARE-associated domain